MAMIHVAATAAGARAARHRREQDEARRLRNHESDKHHHHHDSSEPANIEVKTKTLENDWTEKETYKDGVLTSVKILDKSGHKRETRERVHFIGHEGFRITRYDEQQLPHGECSFVTLDGKVIERIFYNHATSDGDGLHFEIRGSTKTERLYVNHKIVETAEYTAEGKDWLLARKIRWDDEERQIYRESYRFNPHYYLEEITQVLDDGSTLYQKFNSDKTMALSEKHDKDGNLIEYIVNGQNKLAKKLEEIRKEKLEKEQYEKRIAEAKRKREQERKEKSELVNRNAAKVKKAGRGMLTVMKGLRATGLLKTTKSRSK